MSFSSKVHTIPFPDSSPPGGKKPMALTYSRWCMDCQRYRMPKGGKVRKDGFHCKSCV
jgi:hypothetical protein